MPGFFHRAVRYLQDPAKVARFQRLCGVEAPPGWGSSPAAAAAAADTAPLANGSCPAEGGEEGAAPCRFRGPSGGQAAGDGSSNSSRRHSNGLRNGVLLDAPAEPVQSAQAAAAAADQLLQEQSCGPKRKQPRRNSLAGDTVCQEFAIHSPFLHYLFCLGTELGNELFYMLFFPFCMWNLDVWIGRRLIIIWVWVMYLGQCTKDVIRWPRPASPPAVKLEVFYNSEYSMPSTHAMSGTAIPLALLVFSHGRWEYPLAYGLILAVCWSSLVCFSRIYMGMHTILDVIAGFFYAILILIAFLPTVDLIDSFNLTFRYAPLIIISLHLALGIFSFTLDTWSTSRGDTAQILGCGAGVACGSHVNYMLDLLPDPSPEVLPLLAPSLTMTLVGKAVLRLLIGVTLLLLIKSGMKKLTIPLACTIFRIPCTDIRKARQRMEVELPYRYLTYGTVGFSLICLIPFLFHTVGLS